MGKRLYVGNLPYSVTEDGLRDVFGEVGAVESVRIITDRGSGASKGFAFVEMETPELAQNAISNLNGKSVSGRAIVVNEARPQEGPGGGRRTGGGFQGGRGSGGDGWGSSGYDR